VAFETDVNAGALGEHRWGAARGLDTFCYVTIGTGIGGGGMSADSSSTASSILSSGTCGFRTIASAIPSRDVCPFHGDCWEGLASGRALEARWGQSAHELPDDEEIWSLQGYYMALGLVSVICALSPERILLGGGVMSRRPLMPHVRREVHELLNGYIESFAVGDGIAEYVVLPALSPRSGVLGAIALAETA
jgi:fructokinase